MDAFDDSSFVTLNTDTPTRLPSSGSPSSPDISLISAHLAPSTPGSLTPVSIRITSPSPLTSQMTAPPLDLLSRSQISSWLDGTSTFVSQSSSSRAWVLQPPALPANGSFMGFCWQLLSMPFLWAFERTSHLGCHAMLFL